jgi:pilus assembly protein Flp/PilA
MSYGKALLKLVKDESAQDLIEYTLVAALIALGAVVSMRTLATTISTALANVGTRLTNLSKVLGSSLLPCVSVESNDKAGSANDASSTIND